MFLTIIVLDVIKSATQGNKTTACVNDLNLYRCEVIKFYYIFSIHF